jgi:hypothetical protein
MQTTRLAIKEREHEKGLFAKLGQRCEDIIQISQINFMNMRTEITSSE